MRWLSVKSPQPSLFWDNSPLFPCLSRPLRLLKGCGAWHCWIQDSDSEHLWWSGQHGALQACPHTHCLLIFFCAARDNTSANNLPYWEWQILCSYKSGSELICLACYINHATFLLQEVLTLLSLFPAHSGQLVLTAILTKQTLKDKGTILSSLMLYLWLLIKSTDNMGSIRCAESMENQHNQHQPTYRSPLYPLPF